MNSQKITRKEANLTAFIVQKVHKSSQFSIRFYMWHCRDRKACYVLERIHKCLRKYPAARSLIQWKLRGEEEALSLTFDVDEQASQAAQQLDGRYALVTNSELSANEMLLAFKQQASVEHRFRILKDDLHIRPIHL